MNKLFLILSITLVSMLSLQADVYRYVDKDGNTVFTDAPPKGANSKKITVGKPTSASAYKTPINTTAPVVKQSNQRKSQDLGSYTIEVSSPGHRSTINAPGGSLNVVVSVEPAPKSDFTVRILVDGNEASNSTTPIASVEGLTRGSHSFNAQLLAADGSVLATSNTNVVEILRPSVLIQKRIRENNERNNNDP